MHIHIRIKIKECVVMYVGITRIIKETVAGICVVVGRIRMRSRVMG